MGGNIWYSTIYPTFMEDIKFSSRKDIDPLIKLIIEVRVDLTKLCKSIEIEYVKEELKLAINGIDIVGRELSQNISKKLKEKEKK